MDGRMIRIARVECEHCGKIHRNILTSTGRVQCIRCHKEIDTKLLITHKEGKK